jgi:hypothetical protein
VKNKRRKKNKFQKTNNKFQKSISASLSFGEGLRVRKNNL